jgi:hypothetical protein
VVAARFQTLDLAITLPSLLWRYRFAAQHGHGVSRSVRPPRLPFGSLPGDHPVWISGRDPGILVLGQPL